MSSNVVNALKTFFTGKFEGSEGNDHKVLIHLNAELNGHGGDDTLIAAALNAKLNGGTGNDRIEITDARAKASGGTVLQDRKPFIRLPVHDEVLAYGIKTNDRGSTVSTGASGSWSSAAAGATDQSAGDTAATAADLP